MKASFGRRSILPIAILLGSALSGCVQVLSSQPPSTIIHQAPISVSPWSAPGAGDLGSVDATAVSFLTQPSLAGTPLTTFGDFQMTSRSDFAILSASFSDGTNFRGYGRYFKPVGLGGPGFASLGNQFMQLDSPAILGMPLASSSMTVVSSGFSPGGLLLSAFSDSTGVSTDTADYGPAASFGNFANPSVATAPPLVAVARGNGALGSVSGVGWDAIGHAYLGYVEDLTGIPKTLRYTAFTGWDTTAPVALDLPGHADQIQVLSDGLGASIIYHDPIAQTIKAVWTLDADFPVGIPPGTITSAILSTVGADPQGFWAAADGAGNVVVVFIQQKIPNPNCGTSPITTQNCAYRVYGSVRGATGVWTGPTEIDVNIASATNTSVYQDDTFGGINYFIPGITYAGNGRFLSGFAMINNFTHISGIYSLGYTVGTGWDPTANTATVEEVSINSFDQVRVANDIRMVSDGQGHALLMANYRLLDTSNTPTSFDYKVFEFGGASQNFNGWDRGNILGIPTCTLSFGTYCGTMEPVGAVFSSGEALIVMPGPDTSGGTNQFRLYNSVHR